MLPQRVAAVQGNRLIILHPEQIIFAEADRNSVWLTTDRGRIRARGRGLERLESQLHDKGFVRAHRHFVINACRVREVKRGFRGQVSLVMGHGSRKTIPVSRRREAAVRRALGLLLGSDLLHNPSRADQEGRTYGAPIHHGQTHARQSAARFCIVMRRHRRTATRASAARCALPHTAGPALGVEVDTGRGNLGTPRVSSGA